MLAKQLKLLREQAGLTLEEAAPQLDFSVSRLSRIENAQVRIDVHWVRGMLDLYDVGGGRWTELVELARESNRPGWWKAYGLGDNSYIAFETEARRVHIFSLGYVTGLLQTADYARALMVAVPVPRTPEQLDNEVAARVYRQQRLTSADNPLELVTVIDESALHRTVGGLGVLRQGDVARAARVGGRARRARVGVHHPPLRRTGRAGHGLRRALPRGVESRQGRRRRES
jgi:transcriptional regulator with XRE-family HTH domain